ncbi:hypothetical protein HDU92_001898 [Lobulomyces angularis]|nr:hypothetical protein HDU92_001898 [Lobulomyces angularis]
MPLLLAGQKMEYAKLAIWISVLQLVIITTLEIVLSVNIFKFFQAAYSSQTHAGSQPIILVYFFMFIFAQIFQCILSWDAARNRNTMQVIATVIFNVCILGYSIAQYIQVDNLQHLLLKCEALFEENSINIINQSCAYFPDAEEIERMMLNDIYFTPIGNATYKAEINQILPRTIPVRASIIGLIFFFNLIGGFIAWKTYQDYGWMIVRSQGADVQKKKILQRYHLYILSLKLNVYFFIGIAVQFALAGIYSTRQAEAESRISQDEIEKTANSSGAQLPTPNTISGALIPLGIVCGIIFLIYYLTGYFGMKKGSFAIMSLFIFITFLDVAAMFAGLHQVFTTNELNSARNSISIFAVVNIILNLGTFIVAVRCMMDFRLESRHDIFELKSSEMKLLNSELHNHPRTQAVLD